MVSFFIDFDSAIKCKLYAYKFLTCFREASYYRIFFQHSELSRTQIITCKDAEGLWNNQIRCFNQCIGSRAVVFNVFMLIQKIPADLLKIVYVFDTQGNPLCLLGELRSILSVI